MSERTPQPGAMPPPDPVQCPAPVREKEILRKLEALQAFITPDDLDRLESRLRLRAAVLGWTGDPLRQPPAALLADIESILRERGNPE